MKVIIQFFESRIISFRSICNLIRYQLIYLGLELLEIPSKEPFSYFITRSISLKFIFLANARLDKNRWRTWHVGIHAQDNNREAALVSIAYQNSKRAPRWITLCRTQAPKHRFASRTMTTQLRLAEWVDLCLLESRSQLPYCQEQWSLASGRRHALGARGEIVHNHTCR